MPNHLAFSINRKDIISRILIPKYYNPELSDSILAASEKFNLVPLCDLLDPIAGSQLGNWIRREHYGSGEIPYVRTSDLSHWRIRPDFKKGISEAVYKRYAAKQDIRENDVLFVAHGTYLVGAVAIVTAAETKILLQDHIFRLRLRPDAPISSFFLLAALSTSFCRRQIRACQFSADIIDKIGERHLDIMVPIPKDQCISDVVTNSVERIIEKQDLNRRSVADICSSDMRMLRERADTRLHFSVPRKRILSRILLPKYYDPLLELELKEAEAADDEPWIMLSELVDQGLLITTTGVEVGKLAYGTGSIPFLRTSDIADLEVKRDPKHCVSEQIFLKYASKAEVKPGDVLLVRDGTYLVGSSAIIGGEEVPSLICGGLYRLRSRDHQRLNPYTLLALLNLPLVRRQMRARQFTRDVIDTLGKRLFEIRIPSLFSRQSHERGRRLLTVMQSKAALKTEIGRVIMSIEPPIPQASVGRPSWSMRA
ncbi:MAG: hypothetical protein RDU30_03960 [Desulfovibrionaceae bacterium]|nr:hypothetical protein [Desulfovibrionaceae bacterium]